MSGNSDSGMRGRVGYEYDYRFSIVGANEISSVYKLFPDPKLKSFLFEFRTNFVLKIRTKAGNIDSIIIESERYDLRLWEDGDDISIYLIVFNRLEDYWMTEDEIKSLSRDAFDFAQKMAVRPEHIYLNLIPIVMEIEVCTVQQEAETYDACVDRAIRPQNMVPLYLWPCFTSVEERKPMTPMLTSFLSELLRIRVEDIDKGLAALMEECSICWEKTKVGAQISVLECEHAFHSHCIVGLLEDNRLCPTCQSPAYERYIDSGPPLKGIRPFDAVPGRFGSLAL